MKTTVERKCCGKRCKTQHFIHKSGKRFKMKLVRSCTYICAHEY